jgi:hypothetical protein
MRYLFRWPEKKDERRKLQQKMKKILRRFPSHYRWVTLRLPCSATFCRLTDGSIQRPQGASLSSPRP